MNIKVHHIASDLDLLSNQKKHTHLMDSIEYLKQNSGVLMFLDMPNNANKQMKEFGIGAQILKTLKITKINLITSHKNTEFIGLSGYNLEILKTIKI